MSSPGSLRGGALLARLAALVVAGLACSRGTPGDPQVADAGTPDTADMPGVPDAPPSVDGPPLPDAPLADVAPLYDPIPAEAAPSGITVTLEELLTMPPSQPSPLPGDSRLRRHCRINYLGEVPDGSGRLFVPDLNGPLYLVTAGVAQLYLDLAAQVGPDFWSHRGLGTGFGFVAFHPDFAANGRFYTVHTEARDALVTRSPSMPSQEPSAHHGVVTEWTAADPLAESFSGSRRELLRIGFASYIHGIQEIGFDPTLAAEHPERGLLSLAVGDGGVGLATGHPQDLGRPHGKILRIDPAGTDGPTGAYGIPAGNPFVGRPGVLPEIHAYGLRDPHRFSWDRTSGQMLLVSIGEHNIESIYEVHPGANFGWPLREGPFLIARGDPTCGVYPLPADDVDLGFSYPVLAYDHDPPPSHTRCLDTGDAVAGGFVYRGARIPELVGQYVFGDIVDGRLFHADAAGMRQPGTLATIHTLSLVDPAGQPTDLPTLAGDRRVDLRFGQDAAGELYLLSKANGKIWRLGAPPPPALY